MSTLIFGQLESFNNFYEVLQFYFNASLGDWNTNVYVGYSSRGNELASLRTIGVAFNSFFLLINSVLMLNFVIAILSATFTRFED